ncbi:MAG: 2-hydroxyglutaryl-CoA dehydratase, partial [Clostridiales bacterium]
MERQRDKDGRVIFTEEMRKEFTILAPVMSPIHFGIIEKVFTNHGYNLKMLYTTNKEIVDTGLQNVHNDTCYPALLVVGQLLEAINSGEYDKSKLAVMITQTGGGCRASNYIHLLRRALKKNGLDYIPVISLNATGMEKNPGFKLNLQFLAELMYAVIYGDALMLLSHQTRPYEVHKGDTDALIKKWTDRLNGNLKRFLRVKKNMIAIVKDFAAIPMERTEKIRVGIVGEIYVKFAPLGNNNLEKFLEHEDVEIVVPSLLDFMLYCCNHRIEDRELYGIRTFKQIGSFFGEKILLYFQKLMNRVVKRYSAFRPAGDFRET